MTNLIIFMLCYAVVGAFMFRYFVKTCAVNYLYLPWTRGDTAMGIFTGLVWPIAAPVIWLMHRPPAGPATGFVARMHDRDRKNYLTNRRN